MTFADGFATAPTALTAPTEVAGDDVAVVASTVAGGLEFELCLAGVEVGCSASGTAATGSLGSGGVSAPPASSGSSSVGGFGAADAADSVVLVCAPPLLLTVTPDPTWVDDVALLVDDDPLLVEVASLPAVDSSVDVELAELVDDDSEDVPVVSAPATPYPVATAVTSHAATAMPPYPPILAALWAAFRGEGEAKSGLMGE